MHLGELGMEDCNSKVPSNSCLPSLCLFVSSKWFSPVGLPPLEDQRVLTGKPTSVYLDLQGKTLAALSRILPWGNPALMVCAHVYVLLKFFRMCGGSSWWSSWWKLEQPWKQTSGVSFCEGSFQVMLIEAGRSKADGTVPPAMVSEENKVSWVPAFTSLCFPAEDAMWPAASRSCCHDFLTMIDCIRQLPAKTNPSLSCLLLGIFYHSNNT